MNRVHPGDAIDVYVFAKDNSGLATEGIVWARAAVIYDSGQLELAGDVEFGEELPNLQWWGDGKSASDPALHHLTFQAAAGPNRPTTSELLVAHFPMVVMGSGDVRLGFHRTWTEASLGKGYHVPADEFRDVPFNAIERTDLQLSGSAFGHNAAYPVDVNDDGVASPMDVLQIVNALNNGLAASTGDGEAATAPVSRCEQRWAVDADGRAGRGKPLELAAWRG